MARIDEDHQWVEDYCDFCEREGHTFRECPDRDDEVDQE